MSKSTNRSDLMDEDELQSNLEQHSEVKLSNKRQAELEQQLADAVEESGGSRLPANTMDILMNVVLPATNGDNNKLDNESLIAAMELIDSYGLDLSDDSKAEATYAHEAGLLNKSERVSLKHVYQKFLNPIDVVELFQYETDRQAPPQIKKEPKTPAYVMYALNSKKNTLYVRFRSNFNGSESWSLPKRKFDESDTDPMVALQDSLKNDLKLTQTVIKKLKMLKQFEFTSKGVKHYCYVMEVSGSTGNVNLYKTSNAEVKQLTQSL